MRKFAVRAWVSESDRELVRVDAEAIDTLSMGFGLLARLHKGAKLSFLRTKVNDEVWLPHESATAAARGSASSPCCGAAARQSIRATESSRSIPRRRISRRHRRAAGVDGVVLGPSFLVRRGSPLACPINLGRRTARSQNI